MKKIKSIGKSIPFPPDLQDDMKAKAGKAKISRQGTHVISIIVS